MKGDTKESV